MVAYNFKSQFVPLVESGQKRQTIRALGKRRPPIPGEPLQLYTGMRTKQCRKLLDPDPLCVSVMPIRIYWLIGSVTKERMVSLSSSSGHWITLTETRRQQLAIADGFQSFDEFFAFFQNTHGLPFEGVLITWRLLLAEPTPAGQGKEPNSNSITATGDCLNGRYTTQTNE